jgi:hypothetical protein
MAGLMGTYVYIDDLGVSYKVRVDASNAVITGMAAYDGDPVLADLPRSKKMRYRLIKHPANGRYRKLWCGDVADGAWTDGVGTVQAIFDYYTNASANYTLQGRVGEKTRAV